MKYIKPGNSEKRRERGEISFTDSTHYEAVIVKTVWSEKDHTAQRNRNESRNRPEHIQELNLW